MSHECRTYRDLLERGSVADNRVDCDACESYRRRRVAVREALGRRDPQAIPDAGFAARVRARIEPEPGEVLGLAAARLLPIGLALAVVLFWALVASDPAATEVVEESSDVLEWLLDG